VSEVETFIETRFQDALDGEDAPSLAVWCSDRRTRWCSSAGQAAEAASTASIDGPDCYFGLGLHDVRRATEEAGRRACAAGKAPRGKHFTRGFKSTTRIIGGVWADIDFATGAHTKEHLPPDEAAARGLIDRLPLRPSVVVTTGGGLHVYWVFDEPWVFDTDEERERAARLVASWQARVAAVAAESGWVIDATHDLTRVLRLPGTLNYKYRPPRPVAAEYHDARWSPVQIEEWGAAPSEPRKAEHAVDVDAAGLVVDPAAEPREDKLRLMLDLVPRFVETWQRRRKDLPSQSEYDLALSSLCARFGWSDQELVDLMVAHRRNAGLAGKPRVDYYARTIQKARTGMDRESILGRLRDEVDGATETRPPQDVLRDISAAIDLDIVRVVRFMGDPPEFRLYLPEGEIHLGRVKTILTYSLFNAAVASVRLKPIAAMTQKAWAPIAAKLLEVCETEGLGADSDPSELVAEWIEGYLDTNPPSKDAAEAIACKLPFEHRGGLPAFFLPDLHHWLETDGRTRITRQSLARLLRQAGYRLDQVAARQSTGKATTRSVWTLAPASAGPSRRRPVAALYPREENLFEGKG